MWESQILHTWIYLTLVKWKWPLEFGKSASGSLVYINREPQIYAALKMTFRYVAHAGMLLESAASTGLIGICPLFCLVSLLFWVKLSGLFIFPVLVYTAQSVLYFFLCFAIRCRKRHSANRVKWADVASTVLLYFAFLTTAVFCVCVYAWLECSQMCSS
jgi:hypothetical protein